MAKLTSQDQKKIKCLRNFFPRNIEVQVKSSKEGGFYAEILTFPGCITEAETFSELIKMVNDAVEVPRKYLPYMPPLSLAQSFNIFPSGKITNSPIVFSIS